MKLATLATLSRKLHMRRIMLLTCMSLILSVSLVLGPMAQSAAAVTCRNQSVRPDPVNPILKDGKVYSWLYNPSTGTGIFYVPNSNVSGCSYINVQNITGGWGTGGKCWSFRVYFDATNTFTNESGYCAGPNDVVGIAGPVANGTQYGVLILENNNLRLTLRD